MDYAKWLEALTPLQIRDANNARLTLRRRGLKPSELLKDERKVTQPRNAYLYYFVERKASGDYRGLSVAESAKLIGSEWKATPPAERKVSHIISPLFPPFPKTPYHAFFINISEVD